MKKNPSQAKLSLLQELELRISQAEIELQNRRAEIDAVVRRRTHLDSEIKVETERLLALRHRELEKLEKTAQKRLDPLENAVKELQNRHEELRKLNIASESDLKLLNSESQRLQDNISFLTSRLENIRSEIDDLNDQKIQLTTDNEALSHRNSALEDNNSSLIDSNNGLQEQNNAQLEMKERYIVEFEAMKKRSEEELQVLGDKKRVLTSQIERIDEQHKLERADIAARIKACDEREKNLRIRELKVAQGEESIQRNSTLLEL